MTVLDARFYRDPLEILIAEEDRTCKGCDHAWTIRVQGTENLVCGKRRKYGARCNLYHNPTETQ